MTGEGKQRKGRAQTWSSRPSRSVSQSRPTTSSFEFWFRDSSLPKLLRRRSRAATRRAKVQGHIVGSSPRMRTSFFLPSGFRLKSKSTVEKRGSRFIFVPPAVDVPAPAKRLGRRPAAFVKFKALFLRNLYKTTRGNVPRHGARDGDPPDASQKIFFMEATRGKARVSSLVQETLPSLPFFLLRGQLGRVTRRSSQGRSIVKMQEHASSGWNKPGADLDGRRETTSR